MYKSCTLLTLLAKKVIGQQDGLPSAGEVLPGPVGAPCGVGELVPQHEKNKKNRLLGAKGIATRNKDATRGSWPYY